MDNRPLEPVPWTGWIAAATLATAAVLLLGPGIASAGSYATLDEVPAGGGELRLIAPQAAPSTAAVPTLGESGKTAIGFPLRHTDVFVEIRGVMAEVVVEQTFDNPYAEALDAVYVFPLGPDAAVHGYELVIGERTVRGEIAEREAARRRFEQARDEGRTAGLLQQEKPNVFTQEVANVPPGEQIVVRFRYVELVDYYGGEYSLAFPMVVGPRYLPGATSDLRPVAAVPLGKTGRAGVTSVQFLPTGMRSGHDIDLEVRLDAGVPLTGVRSTSHAMVDEGVVGTEQRLGLDPSDVLPNKDFVLRWSAAGENTTIGALTHRTDGEGYVSLLIQPKAEYTEGDITPREVILLIDRSGSMQGEPMAHAREVARGLLGSLGPADTVNVLAFSDSVQAWAATPRLADAAGISDATRFVDGLRGGGGTEMLPGLTEALDGSPGDERVRVVYLLSDGQVGNDDEILGMLGQGRGGLRVYPIGVGSAPNRYLFDRTAEQARGFATYVGPGEPAAEAVSTLVQRSTRPYLTDVQIDWGGLQVHDMTPARLPDVQAGEPVVVSARYRKAGTGTAVLRANLRGQPVEVPLELELPASEDHPAVAHLWARRRIHELKVDHLGQPDRVARKEITDLGLQFGLVTDYTSYVAVDETRQIDRTGARALTQAVPLPDGVRWQGVFGGGGQQQASRTSTTTTTSAPSTPSSTAPAPASRPAAPTRSRRGGSFGGGAIDPVGGLVLLGLAAAAARRRKDGDEESD